MPDELNDDQLAALSDDELEARYDEQQSADLANDPEPTPDVDPVDDVDGDEPDDEPEDLVEDNPVENDDGESDEEDDETPEPSDVVDEGNPDVDPTDAPDETPSANSETPQKFKPLRMNGKDVSINSMEELYALASAGGQFTQKMQEISQYKKSLAVMQKNGLTEQDLSLLIEARNGNKDALASILKQSGVDTLELEDEPSEGYQPGAYVPTDMEVSLMDVQREISSDPEYQITQNVVNNMLDNQSQDMLVQNPSMIRGIHQDIKNGVFQGVKAEADKLKIMDGGRHSDMEYYIAAAKQDAQNNQAHAPQEQAPEPTKPSRNTSRRKAAGSSRPKVQPKKVIDFSDDIDDDELMKYREQVMART